MHYVCVFLQSAASPEVLLDIMEKNPHLIPEVRGLSLW